MELMQVWGVDCKDKESKAKSQYYFDFFQINMSLIRLFVTAISFVDVFSFLSKNRIITAKLLGITINSRLTVLILTPG